MDITVIGCGRWGSFIGWYLDKIGHRVTLYGREGSSHMRQFKETGSNGLVTLNDGIELTSDLRKAAGSDIIIISIGSQGLRALMGELSDIGLQKKTFVLCMKGIEISSGKRLSEIVTEAIDPSNTVAVWLGPGHVQEFCRGIPNCMVIDSTDDEAKDRLITLFSGDLIRFYIGTDLIGNEIGAAAKNVIGIAAGILDGLNLTSLKGALMSRATREIARLIQALGGNELSAYGLCHLGDYEATVFSQYSHNRKFGEAFVTGEKYTELAEGYYTVEALIGLSEQYNVELPICSAVHRVLYEGANVSDEIKGLFLRSVKQEF